MTIERSAPGAADDAGCDPPGTPSRAEVAAWQAIRDMVMNHLATRRTEVGDRLGISFIKAKALRSLTSGPLTMGELTADLSTDPPYTCVVVDDLVARGLAVRGGHPADRRRKLVGLTPTGREMADVAQQILDCPPPGFAALTAQELGQIADILHRVSGTHPALLRTPSRWDQHPPQPPSGGDQHPRRG